MTTLDPTAGNLILINTFSVEPEKAQALVDALTHATKTAFMQKAGFVSANLHISRDGKYVANYAQWRSQADMEAAMQDPQVQAGMRAAAGIASGFTPIAYDLVATHGAAPTV